MEQEFVGNFVMRNYAVAVYLWKKRDRDREFLGREKERKLVG